MQRREKPSLLLAQAPVVMHALIMPFDKLCGLTLPRSDLGSLSANDAGAGLLLCLRPSSFFGCTRALLATWTELRTRCGEMPSLGAGPGQPHHLRGSLGRASRSGFRRSRQPRMGDG